MPGSVIQAFHFCGTNCGTTYISYCYYLVIGGEGGIRTPGPPEGTTDFESAPFGHSGTSPGAGRTSRARGRIVGKSSVDSYHARMKPGRLYLHRPASDPCSPHQAMGPHQQQDDHRSQRDRFPERQCSGRESRSTRRPFDPRGRVQHRVPVHRRDCEPLPRHRRHRARGSRGDSGRAARTGLVDRDPAESSGRKRETPGLNALPASLEAAVDAFERDAAARSWFTPTMAKAYTALKRFEAEAFFKSTPKHMCERYALAY